MKRTFPAAHPLADPAAQPVERWLEIEHHPRYEVSDLGRVRWANPSEPYARKEPLLPRDGWIHLRSWGKTYQLDARILVLEAFVGPAPTWRKGHRSVTASPVSLDGDRANVWLGNLRWEEPAVKGTRGPRCDPNSIAGKLRDDPRLGTVPDADLARAYVCTRQLVSMTRAKLGVEPVPLEGWQRAVAKRRAEETDAKLAPLPLGELPDEEIARLAGVSRETVRARRVARGIPAAASKLAKYDALLGTMPDARIAEASGSRVSSVCRRRLALGKAPFRAHKPYREEA
jgi:hypothetical protein